jgi:hypothetical protein
MEIEYFVEPGTDMEALEKWRKDSWSWWLNKI